MNARLARRRFISRLASAWEASFDLDPSTLDEPTRHAIYVMGQALGRLEPGRPEQIIERRAEEASS